MEKLRDASNWQEWRFVVRTLLEGDDWLEVCEGTLIKPEVGAQEYETKLAKWTKANKSAKKLIVTTMESKPLQLIMNCNTAKDMWQKLHSVFDMKSEESLSLVQKEFFEFRWDPAGNVAQHISKLEQMTSKMQALGGEIPSSMLITRILSTLPPKFNHFHSAWDSTTEARRTVENLTARLMTEELRMQKKDETDESTVALFSKTKQRADPMKRNENKFEKRTYPRRKYGCFTCGKTDHKRKDCKGCFKCGSKDHLARNCTQKGELKKKEEISNESAQAYTGYVADTTQDHWLIDSGASDHMTNRREWFFEYQRFPDPVQIVIGNGEKVLALGRGNIHIETNVSEKWSKGIMYNVLHAPGMKHNLFSVRASAKKGVDFLIKRNGKECVFTYGNKIVAVGIEVGNLYRIDLRVLTSNIACTASKIDTLQLWHERLGHQNKRHIKAFLKNRGVDVTIDNEFCDGCAYGKHHRLHFGERIERATVPRELIHSDVCGPMNVESIGKSRYYVVFKDDYSGYRTIYCIRNKSEVQKKIEIFCTEIKTRFGENIKELRTDGGKEYVNTDVREFLEKLGIKHTVSVPYTPEQNGTAERENRTVVEAARSMLFSRSDLPQYLWAEAINCATHVLNRTGPSKVENKTPYELWFGKKANVDYLKIFGTDCFVHIPKEKRQKLDRKAYKGHFVGYTENVLGYRVWIPELRDIVVSRDVLFKDEKMSKTSVEIENRRKQCDEFSECENEKKDKACEDESSESERQESETEDHKQSAGDRQLRDRSKLKRTNFYGNPIAILAHAEPVNYKEAIDSNDAENWKIAMNEEINSLKENNTYVLVDKPKDKKVIQNRWIFRCKTDSSSSRNKYKARLVIKGCFQKEGIDYFETFSPVVRFDTVRTVLSIAAREKLYLRQFDIKTAFLYGTVNEEIYMRQPEGFEDGTTRVCKLLKSLYGLKQAPRRWSECFKDFLIACDLGESNADPCLFCRIRGSQRFFLVLWVDDGLIAATCEKEIDSFLVKLQANFKATIMTDVKNFLGIEIYRMHDGSIFLSQSGYIKKILDRFKMSDAKPVSTPIDTGWDASDLTTDEPKVPYREAVGHLMYLQVVTRPDIAFAVNVASRALEKPSVAHWRLVKRIMRYIKGTSDVGLHYKTRGELESFSDADFAGDTVTRKSTSGILCKLGNAAITWQSKKQQCVAQSTTEAEYVSAAIAAKEIVWLTRLLEDIGINSEKNILYVDNMSAIKLVQNPELHQRSKHIDVRYHFVRDLYEKGVINIKYVRSEDQCADILTKPLAKPKFESMRDSLGLASKKSLL